MRGSQTLTYLALLLGSLAAPACSDDAGTDTTDATTTDTTTTDATTDTTDTTDSNTDTDTSTDTGEDDCYAELHAIVSDIDETLTTADSEFLMQLIDSTYDPLERQDAAALMHDYHDRGYFILYLTARGEGQQSIDNMTGARDLTMTWLEDHGFPLDHAELVLAPGLVMGDETVMYKAGALMERQAQGYSFDYAYGNADTDIAAYEQAGISKDATFIIGVEAGMQGTVGIDEEDYVMHRASHIPTVPEYCGG